MASVVSNEEYACLYAAMILHDDGSEITAAKLNSIITAAGIKAKPIYSQIFAELLKDVDIHSFIGKMTTSGFAPAASGAPAGAAAPVEESSKKEEVKKEEEKEESSDSDIGFGLFD